jgi:WD40 repeat protein
MPRWLRFSLRSLLLLVLLIASAGALYVNWHPWQTIAILGGHSSTVLSTEFSADGKQILTFTGGYFGSMYNKKVEDTHEIHAWDSTTFKQQLKLQWPMTLKPGYTRACFSPGGTMIQSCMISPHSDTRYNLTHSQTGEPLFNDTDIVWDIKYSKDNRRFLVSFLQERPAEVWDTQKKKLLTKLPLGYSRDGLLSDDGKFVWSAAQLWEVETADILCDIKTNIPEIETSFYFLPDGRFALWDLKVYIKANDGTQLASFSGTLPKSPLSPDGRTLMVVDGPIVRLIDTSTLQPKRQLEGYTYWKNPHFSPDSRFVILTSASSSSPQNATHAVTFMVFDINSGTKVNSFELDNTVWRFVWGPNDLAFITASECRVWSLNNTAMPRVFEGIASISPDFTRLVTCKDGADPQVWDIQTGARIDVLRGHAGLIINDTVNWSPDSQRIITASADKTARIWQRRRPDTANGFLYLPELYLTLALTIALGWSIRRDRKA